MEFIDFQRKCADIVKKIDKKYNIERDSQLSFVQFVEEIGELAKDINLKRLRGKDPDRENFEGEFADVFLNLSILAEMHNVNLEKAVEDKVEKLKERGYLD